MSTEQAIFDRLKEDHDRHRALLDRLLETHGDSAERERLFEELTKELKSHAAAEEQALYSTMMRKFKSFDHQYRHHIDEEEEHHFPDFRNYLDEADVKHMAQVFERRKRQEKDDAEVTPEAREDAKE